MALSCAGLILHLVSRGVRGDSFNPKVCCWRERESQQQPKVYHSGPILMTQNLIASNEYPSKTDWFISLTQSKEAPHVIFLLSLNVMMLKKERLRQSKKN
jgi:hypothetical protein